VWVTCIGVFVVILGVNGIIFTGRYFAAPVKAMSSKNKDLKGKQKKKHHANTQRRSSEGSPLLQENEAGAASDDDDPDNQNTAVSSSSGSNGGGGGGGGGDEEEIDKRTFIIGVIGAVCAGVFGGSYLIPNLSCCADADTEFLPSVGIGCLIVGPLFSFLITYLVPMVNNAVLLNKESNVLPTMDTLLQTTALGALPGIVNVLAVILIIKVLFSISLASSSIFFCFFFFFRC
jgi:hypothetical protein